MEKNSSDIPTPSEPLPIISLDELLQTVEATQAKENADKLTLATFFQMNEIELKGSLKTWAVHGFPDNYVIFEIQLHRLETCMDGQQRDLFQYIQYLHPEHTVAATLSTLQPRLPGMVISYSYTQDFKLCVHVTRL